MKPPLKLTKCLIWVGLLSLVLGPGALAQPPGTGEPSPASRGPGLYNPRTVETVSGIVVSVSPQASKEGLPAPVYLVLKTDRGKLNVLLGPRRFVDRQAVTITALDRVQVTGSRVLLDGKPAFIAAQVHKGNQVLKLRDPQGAPLWGRGRR